MVKSNSKNFQPRQKEASVNDFTAVFREGFSYIVHLIDGDSVYCSKKIRVAYYSDNSMRFMHVWNLEKEEYQLISSKSIVAYEPQFPEVEEHSLPPLGSVRSSFSL